MIHGLSAQLVTKIIRREWEELTFVDTRPPSVVAFVIVTLCTPFETFLSLAEKTQLVATWPTNSGTSSVVVTLQLILLSSIHGTESSGVFELKDIDFRTSTHFISSEKCISIGTTSFSPGPTLERIRASWPGKNLVMTGEGLSH